MINFRDLFHEPEVLNIDVNSTSLLKIHSKILKRKKLLQSAFKTFYQDLTSVADKYFVINGLEIELGSGVGFLKNFKKKIISSDIRKGIKYDLILDATKLRLKNNSVRCFYAINVFHHISYPDKFFNELKRVLISGGGCILIEPHNGFLSKLLHKNIHKNEYYDPNASNWNANSKVKGPLSDANQALAYIVFERDIKIFRKKHGANLEITHKQYELNGLRYLLSGGLNFRQCVPSFFLIFLRILEFLLYPFAKYWTQYQMIVIKKIK
jgi:SAM-dependent methyltransferase